MTAIVNPDLPRNIELVRRAEMRLEILKLASRPQGFKASTHPINPRDYYTVCHRMCKAGELFAVKESHRHVTFYTDKRMAEALKPIRHASQVSIKPRQNAEWSKDEPGIITDKTIFTKCPSPVAFHVKQLSRW